MAVRRRAWLAFAAVCAPLLAQDANRQAPQGPPGTLVDMIVATVNDQGILWSHLRHAARSRIEGLARITAEAQQEIVEQTLRKEISDLQLALAAKSFGVLSPEQVDQYVASDLERDRQAKRRDLGSYNELSQELKRTNRTLQTYEQEQRIDKLRLIANDLTVGRRLAGRATQWVTPRMLREAWADERIQPRFNRDARATLVQVRFSGDNAEAKAAEAAAAWQKEDIDARQLADRYPGAVAIGEVDAEPLQKSLPDMAKFALAGPEGAVSSPIAFQGGFNVGKVRQHLPERRSRFEDADVQDELRNLCLDRVVKEMQAQGMAQASERTQVWSMLGKR